MINNKQEAINEVKKQEVNFSLINEALLQDEDVVLAYVQAHSSNDVISSKSHIHIDNDAMLCNKGFIIQLIKNIGVGYNEEDVQELLKLSVKRIVRRRLETEANLTEENVKEYALQLLNKYKDTFNARKQELNNKKKSVDEIFDSVCNFVEREQVFDNMPKPKPKKKEQTPAEELAKKVEQLFDIVISNMVLDDVDFNRLEELKSSIAKLMRETIDREESFKKHMLKQIEQKPKPKPMHKIGFTTEPFEF